MPDPVSDSVAERVADGQPVDWDEALRTAPDDGVRALVRHLRLVESVARVHRDPPAAASIPAAPVGKTWGPLELRGLLGAGGFGEVYRAWDRRLEREVALKLLKTGASAAARATAAVEEGRLLAKLRHPNVVTVFGAEVHDGRVGIWMELIRGRSLEQIVGEQGPFGAREAALIGVDLCRALAAVHGARVVHRDVKADNALREEGGRIVLTDFGAGLDARAESDATLSGTPFYMAPEQFLGVPASPRSDIYSLGVLLYRLVTGSFPLEAKSWNELRDRHARREAKLLRDQRPDLPQSFVLAIERAMAPDPEARFATAGQMEQALAVALGSESGAGSAPPNLARRPGPTWRRYVLAAAGIGVAVVGSALVLSALVRQSGAPPVAGDEGRRLAADGGAATRSPSGVDIGTAPTGADAAASPAKPPAGGSAPAASYRVEATLYRVPAGSAVREPVAPGSRLTLGDTLTLEFEASSPTHVYVIDQDDAGHAFALFPLPGFEPRNPLPPGTRHVLPGSYDGRSLSWTVDSAGGREHLLVLASPTRLVEFEAEMNGLARPGQTAVPIPASAVVRLRGLGGLTETPATKGGGASAERLFEMAKQLAAGSEWVQGVWMRRIDLENPQSR